jgi:hypothetical protein
MATSLLTSKTHLEEHDLGPEFRALIGPLLEEVDKIGFEPDPNTSALEICDDKRLLPALRPLLDYVKFTKVMKILPHSSILPTKTHQGVCGVRRVTRGGTAPVTNRTGVLYIITLRTSESPKIAGKPLHVGHSIYLKEAVLVDPRVDCLLLAPED